MNDKMSNTQKNYVNTLKAQNAMRQRSDYVKLTADTWGLSRCTTSSAFSSSSHGMSPVGSSKKCVIDCDYKKKQTYMIVLHELLAPYVY